jgi:hypothetical protein
MRLLIRLCRAFAVAILSTALLCASVVFGSAAKPRASLPITVDAPRQAARPQRTEVTPQVGPVGWHTERRHPRDPLPNGDWTPTTGDAVGCAGPIMVKLCPALEREASSCKRWLRPLRTMARDPWVGCSLTWGLLLNFLSNLAKTHSTTGTTRAMRRNQNVPGLGPTTILMVIG